MERWKGYYSYVINNINDNGEVEISKLNAENRKKVATFGYSEDKYKYGLDSEVANHILKTVPIKSEILKNGSDCAFLAYDEMKIMRVLQNCLCTQVRIRLMLEFIKCLLSRRLISGITSLSLKWQFINYITRATDRLMG